MSWGPTLRLEIAILFEDVAHPERDMRMERWRSWRYQRRRDLRLAERELIRFLRKSRARWRPRPASPRPDLEALRAHLSARARARLAAPPAPASNSGATASAYQRWPERRRDSRGQWRRVRAGRE